VLCTNAGGECFANVFDDFVIKIEEYAETFRHYLCG